MSGSSYSKSGLAEFPAVPLETALMAIACGQVLPMYPMNLSNPIIRLRIERYETIPDSYFVEDEEGVGLTVAYRFLCDGEVGIHDDRWLTYPWGVLGGETGLRSTKKIVRSDGSEEWLPGKVEGVKVKTGDVLYFNTWGGGGWGDPFARDPELVRQDVSRRLVTVEGAKRYGVVLALDGAVDVAKTEELRAELKVCCW